MPENSKIFAFFEFQYSKKHIQILKIPKLGYLTDGQNQYENILDILDSF